MSRPKANRRVEAGRERLPVNRTRKHSGATGATTGLSDRLMGFVRHHRNLLLSSFKRLTGEPVQTLMTSLVIGIALGLPAFFYLAVVNMQSVGDAIDVNGQITVFVEQAASPEAVERLSGQLKEMRGVGSVSYISPQQALVEFRERSGFGDALLMLDENPLPGVLVIVPDAGMARQVESLQQLAEHIQSLQGVDDVVLDMGWLERLNGLLLIAKKLTLSLGAALALGVLLIVGNTIRLEIENRKSEIVVVKLVGGTDAFVRRPFLYAGFWYGCIGGALAWVLVSIVLFSVSSGVAHLASLYQSAFQLRGAGFTSLLVLLLLGAILGLVGSFIAVARHLSAIEPA